MTLIKPSNFDSTTFTLKVTGLSKTSPLVGNPNSQGVTPNPEGLSDVVYKVFWELTGTDTSTTPNVVSSKTGSTLLDTTGLTSSNIVSFSSLTNDIVSGWLINSDPFISHKYTICNNILETKSVEDTSVPW
tara:strand:- start:61 stop:453 length:393 start_codon:yes stop_codon:yes gene_type:complete